MICVRTENSLRGLLTAACFVLCASPVFAAKPPAGVPDPSKLVVTVTQEVLTPEQEAMQERLPVDESGNDGYWWNKQIPAAKTAYVKQLIISFKLIDKKLPVKNIVKALDTEYNPRDNPEDIRIDKSVERMFNVVTKEMMRK